MKGIVPIWALFFPMLFAGDFAVAQLNHEVASLLRVKSHLRSFECRVQYVETTSGRHHSKLLVFRDSEQEPVLAFDPGGPNRLFQMFVMDLTGDENPELVTFWQHGVYEQVVVFSLESDPRQILWATGRGGCSLRALTESASRSGSWTPALQHQRSKQEFSSGASERGSSSIGRQQSIRINSDR
jgi:hypothetical protein